MRHAFAALIMLTGLIVTPGTPPAMAETVNETLEGELKTEDAALNATYKRLMARLGPVAKQRLTASELAWITFRDTQRHADADMYRGGTMAATAALACKIRLTGQRTKDLQFWLKRLDAPVFTGLNRPARERALSQQKGAYAQADHLLNQAYKAVLAPQDAEGRKLTLQAQLAWLAFRDKEAAFAEAFAGPRGETALMRQLTLTELTGSRAEDLQAIADEWKSR